ncbi:hypothetical protein BOX15_Mlig034191g2 [Macrostomum lignano]|uniref:Uncharacterized protein n=1 Tax=Macrostomum lignano TaxID=282301 RepID=A0A267GQY8_9PLAT|nr:hypothetical protein BOX15_Mlig034191g2 [Macrostomum lignano]
MPLNVFRLGAIGILFFACIAVTNSIKCYEYDAEKDGTPEAFDCNEALKKIKGVAKLEKHEEIKHCKRMHGYKDGKYFAGGFCGDCSFNVPLPAKSFSITCSACTSEKCNSASRKGSVSPAAATSLAACLLWLLNCSAF